MLVLVNRVAAVILIVSLVLFQMPELRAQGYPASSPPTPQQLDQLLAPVALYPDSLLAQITTASTNPQEILDVTNWLATNQGMSPDQLSQAAQQQGFDPAFVSLVHFPTVLQMMAENIDDYATIGQAVTANQAAVSESVQRLRAQAYAAGGLHSNPQQTVVVQQGPQPIYVIQPANPQVVYVPQYNPTVVYVRPSTGAVVATSLITFGVGIGIGALIASNQPWGWGGWGWNWRARGIYYNHGGWNGWHGGYRPPTVWYRPRPVVYTSRPGYGGNWNYRPPNYHPPYATTLPTAVRPGAGGAPVYSRPPANSGYGAKPGQPVNRYPSAGNGGRPYTPPAGDARPQPRPAPAGRPQPQPAAGAPGQGRPGGTSGNRSPQPGQGNQPQVRPAPQTQQKPQPQTRPQTQQRPQPQQQQGKPQPQQQQGKQDRSNQSNRQPQRNPQPQ